MQEISDDISSSENDNYGGIMSPSSCGIPTKHELHALTELLVTHKGNFWCRVIAGFKNFVSNAGNY